MNFRQLFFVLTLTTSVSGFTFGPAVCGTSSRCEGPRRRLGTVVLKAIETISLSTLENHEEDGTKMAESITKWLDQEWIPQQVHIDMAESAKKSYITCREEARDEVADILMQVADDLSDSWAKYDADAFVNAWDIANYVADYLTLASGSEGCECSEAIVDLS